MKSIKIISIILISVGIASCSISESSKKADNASAKTRYSDQIQKAHKIDQFLNNESVMADISLYFGGKERLNARMTLSTNGNSGHYHLNDGSEMIYNNDTVWVSSDYTKPSGARFSAYTWSYFFLMPYKLNDPGTNWSAYPDTMLNGNSVRSEKLTFNPGIGDAPDDWYIVYSDPETHLLEVAAYIVTAGQSKNEAEQDPHAIKYSDYRLIDGIPFAHRWDFFAWRVDSGLTDTLGCALLKNFQLGTIDEEQFYFDEEGILIPE